MSSNHGYATGLNEAEVIESLAREDRVLPLFMNAVHKRDEDLCRESTPDDGTSLSP